MKPQNSDTWNLLNYSCASSVFCCWMKVINFFQYIDGGEAVNSLNYLWSHSSFFIIYIKCCGSVKKLLSFSPLLHTLTKLLRSLLSLLGFSRNACFKNKESANSYLAKKNINRDNVEGCVVINPTCFRSYAFVFSVLLVLLSWIK